MINETGNRYGRLFVLGLSPLRSNGRVHFVCRCDCGKTVVVKGVPMRDGRTRSCGCLRRDLSRTHGEAGVHRRRSLEYRTWHSMIQRCTNPKATGYAEYGARGIKVCDRWRTSYPAFLADMGRKPTPKHSIDRYPAQGGNYEPGNCRWATALEQGRNTRSVKLTIERAEQIRRRRAEGLTIVAIGLEFGVHHSVVSRVCAGKAWATPSREAA